MIDLLLEFASSLTWRGMLVGASIFVATFLFNLAVVSFILVKLPADHFSKGHQTKFWSGPNPALRAAGIIGKNVLGVFLVGLGVVLSLPGVPGQGLLTVLLGVMLVDFPGKGRLEQKLLSRPAVVNSINRLRQRFGKAPLELN